MKSFRKVHVDWKKGTFFYTRGIKVICEAQIGWVSGTKTFELFEKDHIV